MRRVPKGSGQCSAAENGEGGWGNSSKGSDEDECRKLYGAVAIVALGCYINGLGGDFVHDDIPAIVQNKDVLGQSHVTDLLRNDFWGTDMADAASHKSYRPLTVLTFRANHWAFGLHPYWFHAFNVALHAVASLLFTKVCLGVAGLQPKFAAAAGALFAAHPVHTEAVTGIVGRADVLACVFFLLSFLAYHGRSSNSDGGYGCSGNICGGNGSGLNQISGVSVWLSALLGGLSMLAKETGVTVMVVNLAYDVYRSWPFIKRTIVEIRWNEETLLFSRRAAKVLISLCLLLVFRLALLQGSLPRFSVQDNPTAFHPSRHVRFLTFCYLAAFNCWLLLCPVTLSHDWQMGSVPLVTSLADSRNVATCLFAISFLALAYRGIADFEQQRHPPLLLGILFLVLPFLPAANLLVTVGFVVAERVLFIPSLGFVLLVVYGAQLLWSAFLRQRSLILCAGLVILLLAFCGRSVVRNADWATRESLVRAGLKVLPHNAKMHYNFANFLRDTGDVDRAVGHYREALRLWPSYASAHNNLGTLVGGSEEAEGHFLAAIRHSPNHVNAHYNLGQVYRRINRTEEALRMLRRCILLDASYVPAYLLLAKLYSGLEGGGGMEAGEMPLAGGGLGAERRRAVVGNLLRHITLLVPRDPDSLAEYASWLRDVGRPWEALQYFQRALMASPGHRPALIGAARTLKGRGHVARARRFYKRALYRTRNYYSIHDYSAIFAPSGKLHVHIDEDPEDTLAPNIELGRTFCRRPLRMSTECDQHHHVQGAPSRTEVPSNAVPRSASSGAAKKRRRPSSPGSLRGRGRNGTRGTAPLGEEAAGGRREGREGNRGWGPPCAAAEEEAECLPVLDVDPEGAHGGTGGTSAAAFNQGYHYSSTWGMRQVVLPEESAHLGDPTTPVPASTPGQCEGGGGAGGADGLCKTVAFHQENDFSPEMVTG
ncbi:protein O-mannosyl-transferase TMTC1-like [Ischnura elegans]|uniref:protein O-mannosyl-transferase TMTC1-like n=1 Tax=Ischnura elegans TaxID=197161 RepID=UPI001ED88FB8|nr:protein O-mannosyl-transferase TMTC1-like [Ischnura elegans]